MKKLLTAALLIATSSAVYAEEPEKKVSRVLVINRPTFGPYDYKKPAPKPEPSQSENQPEPYPVFIPVYVPFYVGAMTYAPTKSKTSRRK